MTTTPKSPFSSSSTPSQPSASPFSRSTSGLLSRLGGRVPYEFLPLHDNLVRFSLADVSGEIYQLLNIPVPHNEQGGATPENIKPLIAELEKDRTLQDKLRDWLAEGWDALPIIGAVHVYDWQEDTRTAVNTRLTAAKQAPNYTRSLDAVLTLNILARSRSYLMMPDAAIALDRPFLERVLLSDDTRLLKFAQDRPHKEDLIVEPPPPPPQNDDADFDED